MKQIKNFPLVDYTDHPAFAPYSPAPRTELDISIERHFSNIDAKLTTAGLVTEMTDQEVDKMFDLDVRTELQNIYSLRPKSVAEKPELENLLKLVLSDTSLALKKDIMFLRADKGYKPSDAKAVAVISAIKEDGIYSCTLSAEIIERMNRLTKDLQQELFGRRTGRMDCTVVLDISGEFGKLVLFSLEKEGIIEGVSGYLGRQVEPMYCGLQLSHQDDDWWSNCYSDIGLPTAKTVYMHLDQAVTIPKTVIYLTEVKKENGPFRLIKGSHLWNRSAAQTVFFKMLDDKWGTLITKDDLQQAPPNYYRKWIWSPKGRRYFSSLPYSLRGTSHFGDDILDGSELSRNLLADETAFLSEEANCVTFIGGRAIHRGSQVKSGHRVNLQIAWVPKPRLVRRIIRSTKRTAARIFGIREKFTFK